MHGARHELAGGRGALEAPQEAHSLELHDLLIDGSEASITSGGSLGISAGTNTVIYAFKRATWALRFWDDQGQPLVCTEIRKGEAPRSNPSLPPPGGEACRELLGRSAIELKESPGQSFWFRAEGTAWARLDWDARAASGHDIVLGPAASLEVEWGACPVSTRARWLSTDSRDMGAVLRTFRPEDGIQEDLPAEELRIAFEGRDGATIGVEKVALRAKERARLAAPCTRATSSVSVRVEGLEESLDASALSLTPLAGDGSLLAPLQPLLFSQQGALVTAHFEKVPVGPFALRAGPLCVRRTLERAEGAQLLVQVPPRRSCQILFTHGVGGPPARVRVLAWTWTWTPYGSSATDEGLPGRGARHQASARDQRWAFRSHRFLLWPQIGGVGADAGIAL